MGREVRRVPLDFDWPQGETWEGYLEPGDHYPPNCEACGGRGETAARLWVQHIAHLALIADDDLDSQACGRAIHPYLRESGTVAYGTRPSEDYREFGTGLAGRSGSFGGHDAIDRYAATDKLIAAAGLDPETWGKCPACSGRGENPTAEQLAAREAWEPTEPPTGDGWQMWETTSEGSPMSPVFATAEELAAWLADNGASLFGSNTATREQWLAIITGDDFAHVKIAPGVIMM